MNFGVMLLTTILGSIFTTMSLCFRKIDYDNFGFRLLFALMSIICWVIVGEVIHK